MLAQRPSNKLGGGIAEFVDYDVPLQTVSPPFEVRRWLHFKCLNWLVGVLRIRVYLDRGLDAVPYIGTDRDCRRMACHDDLSLSLYGLVIFDVGW